MLVLFEAMINAHAALEGALDNGLNVGFEWAP